MNDITSMELALAEAERAIAAGERPFGTVIVMTDGRVIASAHVTERAERSALAHSELNALALACRALGRTDLHDCTIYCTAEPCLMCSAAIFQAKIHRVVIAASRSDLPFLRRRELGIDAAAADSGYSIEIVRDICRDQSLTLFQGVR